MNPANSWHRKKVPEENKFYPGSASSDSTVAEHWTTDLEIKGLKPTTAWHQWKIPVAEHWTTDPAIKGLNPATYRYKDKIPEERKLYLG